jgi:hypothetical protein
VANKTIVITSELYSGTVGMKLFLLNKTSGAIGNNVTGDTLTEGANGLFSTVVDEAITGWWRVLVTDSVDSPLIEGGWVYITSDTVATYVVDDPEAQATSITITPLSSEVEQRVDGTTITVFLGENITVGPIVVTDSEGDPVDLSATCEIVICKKFRGDILIIPDGSIARSGAGNNQFSFSSAGATLIPGTHSWALRRVSDNFVYSYGDWIVKQVATKD